MHEAQQTKETEAQEVKGRKQRPYKFYVAVVHRPTTAETVAQPVKEFLEFEDKGTLRDALAQPQFDGAEIRIVRGYEMNVKARRSVSIN